MRYLLAILLLLAPKVFGANGDITGAQIESNGGFMLIWIEGYSTNNTFNFGFGTNNSLTGDEAVRLAVVVPGFDSTGASNISHRTIYGTRQLRRAYPFSNSTSNLNDVTIDGSNVKIRVALSDYIFAADLSATITVKANWYSNNAAATFPVTNSSAMAYPKVIGKWTTVPYQWVTTGYKVGFVASHISAGDGKPVACVKFITDDASGHSITNTVSQCNIDRSSGDFSPVVEYWTNINTSALTTLDIITNNALVFPRYGTNYLWTGDGRFNDRQPYYFPHLHKLDKARGYGRTYALVSTNGTTGGVASTNEATFFSSPPAAFASISQAARAIADTNNALFGHNDCGGGVIVLTNGDYSFVGTAASPPTTGTPVWLTITNWPGQSPRIVNGTGNGDIQDRIQICGIRIEANEAFTFSAISNLWFDRCIFNVTNSTADMIDGTGLHYLTGNTISNLDQGIRQQGSQNTTFALVRGNYVEGNCVQWQPYCLLGNVRYGRTNLLSGFVNTALTGLPQSAQEIFVAFNKFYQINHNGAGAMTFYQTTHLTNGAVFAQNLMESVSTNAADTDICFHCDGSTVGITNFMRHGNTLVGKVNSFYNDSGSAAAYGTLCSDRNNIWTDDNTKHDTFTTANAARIGNWWLLYGVSCSDNYQLECATSHSPGEFLREFAGLRAYQPVWTNSNGYYGQPVGNAGFANSFPYPKFVDDQSYSGTGDTSAGAGNYRLQSPAPSASNPAPADWIWPFDLDGNNRGGFDPPGAYASASPRKGGAFFGQ